MGRSKAVGSSSRKKIQSNENLSFKNKTRVSLSSIILCALFALVSFYIVILSNVVRNHKLGSPLLDGGVTNGIENSKSTPLGLQPYDNYNDKNIIEANNHLSDAAQKKSPSKQNSINLDRILTAYLEPIVVDFNKKPLPTREVSAHNLVKKSYPNVNSCSKLIEQFPVNNYPDDDPFLPWIHDVFPTHDGKWIQIVAQNKRRCKTGKSDKEKEIYLRLSAQVSLFQHVPVKRLDQSGSTTATATGSTTRYRLASHEDADDDGMQTRFICRFSNGEETLSVFNFSYEWASFRKNQLVMFHEDTSDNKQIHTSQLLFRCPVPKALVETIRTGSSVKDDFATIFLDIVPIRTPVRYGAPNVFLPPYYKEFQDSKLAFDPAMEWGTNHTLPLIENSGRWANIPICKPTLLTYGNHIDKTAVLAKESEEKAPVKMNRLVSCIWASAGYSTRGNRFAINDGQRRLLEWIAYNKLIGIDHFYVYDNSGAFSNDVSLKFVADMFPNDVTLINWPSQVCNNNPNNVDSPGERSSQYAAESSCRLRFGDHTDWIAQFDIDEYLVPMGKSTSLRPLLDKLDSKGEKIISFGSWRAWPRRAFIEDPNLTRMNGGKNCGRKKDCFQLRIPANYTMLQAYNCDRQKPGKKAEKMPAEKQLYRPDYVLHHFIHYSTVTAMSNMNRHDIEKLGRKWNYRSPFPDPLSRFGDEVEEALMLHTKAVANQDTVDWENVCLASYKGNDFCRLGLPFPDNLNGSSVSDGQDGLKFNCYVNHKIDDYWVKRLENKLKDYVPEIAKRVDETKYL